MSSIKEQLTHTTVRIESEIGTGTGFFFNFDFEGKKFPAIITNKHVVRGAKKGNIILKLKDKLGKWDVGKNYLVTIENFEDNWIFHPEDDVDLCFYPFGPVIHNMEERGFSPFYISLDESLLPKAEEERELEVLEDIAMVGYPNGIWDSVNNLPIVRTGVTATPFFSNYKGKAEFMIDAACFNGSSGSPVFLLNLGSYFANGVTNIGASRIKLLGILYAGPQPHARGEIKMEDIPKIEKPVAYTPIPNNLGLVIKSRKILDLKKLIESKIKEAEQQV